MKKFLEVLLIWLVIIVLISVAYIQFSGNIGSSKTIIPFSEFLTRLEENDVENIVIKNQSIEGKFRDGSSFNSSGVIYSDLIKNLHDRKVRFSFSTGDSAMNVIGGLLISWVPTFIFIGFLLFFLKQTQAGATEL